MLKVYDWNKMSREEKRRLLRRAELDIDRFVEQVRPVVEGVRDRGDKAVAEFTEKFDKVKLKPSDFKVRKSEFDEARKKVDAKVVAAIEEAVGNIRTYHERQMPQALWITPVRDGVFAGEKITPIASCGLYVPRGKGSFPSVMAMLGAPAVAAGVENLIVCTPPGPGGECDAATLVAARACGVENVYRVGGAQSIAAMAYGTAKIPKMDKVIGPGSSYVAAAKRILFGVVDVGVPAGPSESIILADKTTDPDIAAADLLIEQEHGPDSTALLVTDSEALIREVSKRMPALVKRLPEPRRTFATRGLGAEGFGGAVLTRNLAQSIAFVNEFAPEHLEVLVFDPVEAVNGIKNAGEILIGPDTPITLGNFNLGIDAILPTGGFARTFSCVSVFDFLKRTSIGYATPSGFDALAPGALTLANYEGFPAHAQAVKIRMDARKAEKALAKGAKKKASPKKTGKKK